MRRSLVLLPLLGLACSDSGTARPGDGAAGPDLSAVAPLDLGHDAAGDGGEAADLLRRDGSTFKERCFANIGNTGPTLDYDQFHPKYATTHCAGTHAQDIKTVEKVVFLGDSVTVGSPPTLATDFYRYRLAQKLSTRFALQQPEPFTWAAADVVKGTSLVKQSGDFWSCAKWGARTDDLHGTGGNDQIAQCFTFPETKRTLVVMTMGGNDLNHVAQMAQEGADYPAILAEVDQALQYLSDALDVLKDPRNFPNGVAVVMANVYEFTDGTGDLKSCPVAGVVGYSTNWPGGTEAFIRLNEGYARIAAAKDVDLVFMMEQFCGHGFKRDDPTTPCYRGANVPLWYDPVTCIHPNGAGHIALADLFYSVINNGP